MPRNTFTCLAYLLFILLLGLSGRELGVIEKLAVFPLLLLIIFLGLAGRGGRYYQGMPIPSVFPVLEKPPLLPVPLLPGFFRWALLGFDCGRMHYSFLDFLPRFLWRHDVNVGGIA